MRLHTRALVHSVHHDKNKNHRQGKIVRYDSSPSKMVPLLTFLYSKWQTLDPFSFSDFLFKLGCSSICFVYETESCHVAHELSQLLHVNHLELISRNDTLEIEEGKKNLFSLDHILKTVHMGPLSHLPRLQSINWTRCQYIFPEQWLSARGDIMPQGTLGNIWTQFWLSWLQKSYWYLLGRSQACF